MATQPSYDQFGHLEPAFNNGTSALLAAGALALAGAAGSTASVTAINGADMAGSATIASAGTGQAAGVIATLTFANGFFEVPKGVIVNVFDQAATAANMGGGYATLTAASFQITVGTALVAAHNYTLTWLVIV